MSIIPQETIIKKRNGATLSSTEINIFVQGLSNGQVSDPQAAAFAMAILMNGMSVVERTALTTAIRDSGKVLSWNLDGPVADKHSTGGIGDKVSLILGPIAAACGLFVLLFFCFFGCLFCWFFVLFFCCFVGLSVFWSAGFLVF